VISKIYGVKGNERISEEGWYYVKSNFVFYSDLT